MAIMMAMLSQQDNFNFREEVPKNKYPKEPMPQKGQFHYWFRHDGTFLNEKQSERMKKEECVFVCFAINDKNAIRKFKKFINQ